MEQLMGELLKVLIATIVAGVVSYVGIINKLRSKMLLYEKQINDLETNCKEAQKKFEDASNHYAVIEEKVKRIESRQDSHSKKYDELMLTINELKIEMVRQFSGIKSEINSFSAMVEASDAGVKVKKNNG